MNTLWIADAHLSEPASEPYEALRSILARYSTTLDCLVLLGDLFQIWLGDNRILASKHEPLLKTLFELRSQGKQIHYLKGNHDFLLGQVFTESLRAEIYDEEAIFEWDGYRFLASHGEHLDPTDYGYRILRKVLRSRWTETLIRVAGDQQALRVGMRVAAAGKATPNEARLQNTQRQHLAYAESRLREGFHAVILAHTHRVQWHPLAIAGRQAIYVNPGSWIEDRTYLWYSRGSLQLRRFSAGGSSILFDFALSIE
jgi:UDP-2,3-diacylglucosamine hydrolase